MSREWELFVGGEGGLSSVPGHIYRDSLTRWEFFPQSALCSYFYKFPKLASQQCSLLQYLLGHLNVFMYILGFSDPLKITTSTYLKDGLTRWEFCMYFQHALSAMTPNGTVSRICALFLKGYFLFFSITLYNVHLSTQFANFKRQPTESHI